MVVKERGSLVNPCSFMNTPLVFNNNMYAFGNDIYVHKYNIPQQEWSVILKTVQWGVFMTHWVPLMGECDGKWNVSYADANAYFTT